MKSARITVRCNPDGDLILGKNVDLLKPGHVYEIIDMLGELIIKDLGESVVDNKPNLTQFCWGHDANTLIECSDHLLTKDEYIKRSMK
jgi:hypothetical protein